MRLRPKPLAKVTPVRRVVRPTSLPAKPAIAPQPATASVRFVEVTPSLAVRDVARSRAFYHRLGFEVAAQLPPTGPAEWLRLQRDGVALLVWNQIIASPEILAAMVHARGAGNAVRIVVSDVDRLARELVENGVALQRVPETMPDGVREFSVLDPDGYLFEFASRSSAPLPPDAAA